MPEIRKDPIVNRWVIMSEERGARPSDFSLQTQVVTSGFCPFCEGSERHTPSEVFAVRSKDSVANQPGWKLRVVPNKFPALSTHGNPTENTGPFWNHVAGYGRHEVIVETPRHAQRPSDLSVSEWILVLEAFQQRLIELRNDPKLKYALIFKNHGAPAGATVDHLHSQIIATPIVPLAVGEELRAAAAYHEENGECVFCRMIREETADRRRIVCENNEFVSVQAYASRFPCETWILGKRHESRFEEDGHIASLAEMISETMIRLDKAIGTPPFNMVLHTAPYQDLSHANSYHWHIEILPKLTQTAGFEWGSGFFINPMLPEKAAESLRDVRLS